MNLAIPDDRYFKGQLWRCTNPLLNEDEWQRLFKNRLGGAKTMRASFRDGMSKA